MSRNQRQCGCLGGNENCQFCWGSGYVGTDHSDSAPNANARSLDRLISSSIPTDLGHSLRSTPERSDPVAGNPQAGLTAGDDAWNASSHHRCRWCSALLYPWEQAAHELDKHTVEIRTASTAHEIEAPFVRFRGVVFERARFVTQQPRKPSPTRDRLVAQLSADRRHDEHDKRANHDMTTCPICAGPVSQRRLKRHIRKVHGADAVCLSTRAIAAQRSAPPWRLRLPQPVKAVEAGATELKATGAASDLDDDLALDRYAENRRLDGSRDYWGYREEGRFGSHPSFDDMDDDSDP